MVISASLLAVFSILACVSASGSRQDFLLMEKTNIETGVFFLDSGLEGNAVLVVGGIHGDELAGIAAAKKLAVSVPARGKLIVIPVANRLAAEAGTRIPYSMDDLNRSFPGKKTGNDTERLAFSIMGVIARFKPAVVIDLHEAGLAPNSGDSETADTLIISEEGRAAEIALAVLEALDENPLGKRFTFLAGAPRGSLNREVSEHLGIPVITVETDGRDRLEDRVLEQLKIVKLVSEYFGQAGP